MPIPKIGAVSATDVEPTVVQQIPEPPVIRGSPPVIPAIPTPVVNVPYADVPTYDPIDVPEDIKLGVPRVGSGGGGADEKETEKSRQMPDVSAAVRAANSVQEAQPVQDDQQQQPASATVIREMQVPILGSVPIPTNKEVALAGTTAMAATAAALAGKSAVDFLLKFFKPVANQMWLRLKKAMNRDLSPYELQLYFAFEKQAELKKISKLLERERKRERLRQHQEHLSRQRLSRFWRRAKPDESRSQPSQPPRT